MRPKLSNINPKTGVSYTPSELADIAVNKAMQPYESKTSAYGDTTVRTGQTSIAPSDNNYSDYLESGYQIGRDNQEARAENQSWAEQMLHSTAKMGTTALSTFADGTAGLVAGLGNMALGEKTGISGNFNEFINNPFSNAVVDFQQKMEEKFPNYYTKDELSKPWYERLGTSNFWGETILKNFGFAIGAMGSGILTGMAASEVTGLNAAKNSSKLLRGLATDVLESKNATTAEKMLSLTDEQLANLTNDPVFAELAQSAKAVKAKTAYTQAISSFLGSVGEARLEALQDSRDWKTNKLADIEQQFKSGSIDQGEYEARKQRLEDNEENYQNSLFSTNLALLSVSNFLEFRNTFAKGFSRNKVAADAVTRNAEGVLEVAERSKLSKAIDYAKLLKNPFVESQEEQLQYTLQKATDHYYDLKTDNEANANTQTFIHSIGKGLNEAYGKAEGWENMVSGAIIGALGVPTIGRNAKGKIRPMLAGGVWEERADQKHEEAKLKLDVEKAKIFDFYNNTNMRKLYDMVVVDTALQQKRQNTLLENDEVNGKTINTMQLANMVDAFVEIGKYDDFIDNVKFEKVLGAPQLREKYKYKTKDAFGKEVEVDFFKGMTDDQVVSYINQKAEKTIAHAEKIKNIKDDIDTRFSDYSEDNKKDMLLKASSTMDIDERITKLAAEIKDVTGKRFLDKKNLTDSQIANALDFFGLMTPVELQKYLNTKEGLKEYRALVTQYLAQESNSVEALRFAEKARDLETLVGKRQVMNDLYFKMADKRYAENQDALNRSKAEETKRIGEAQQRRYKEFYDNSTNVHPEFGFDSDEHVVEVGEAKKNIVEGTTTDESGNPISTGPIEYLRQEGAERTSKEGVKFKDYIVLENGKEVKKQVANPVGRTEKVKDTRNLRFREGDVNNMYDQNGNQYALSDLEQDPTFLNGKVKTIEEQRTELINKVRKDSLNAAMKNNMATIEKISEEVKAIEESIADTKDLLQKAKTNKTGRTSRTINGVRTTFKVFELEAKLKEHEDRIADLMQQRSQIFEDNNRIISNLREAENNKFTRESFGEEIAVIEKQIKDVEEALKLANAKATTLRRLIGRLKNLLGAVYSNFKRAYIAQYGVDPSTVSDIQKYWQTSITPILRKLRSEELNRLEHIDVKEDELNSILDDVKELERFLQESKDLIDRIKKDQAYFEDALSKVLSAKRLKQLQERQATTTKSDKKDRGIDEEITDTQEDKVKEQMSSPKPSVVALNANNKGKTAGVHIMPDGELNPNKSQVRWFRTVAKINLSKGKFSLRVVTNQTHPELFKAVPEDKKDAALATILYKDGNPVGSDMKPVDITDVDRLVYTYLPLETLSTDFGDKFFDIAENPEIAKEYSEKIKAFREELHNRLANNKESYLPITDKSLGLLKHTNASRKDENNDLTYAVFNHIFKGDGAAFTAARIEVAKAATPEQAQAGEATLSVGGKSVTVKSGLAYLITEQGVVIPLLSRKLNENEVNMAFDLLRISSDGLNEITTDADEEVKTKSERKFVIIKSAKTGAALKKKGVRIIKKGKKYGYYKTVKGKQYTKNKKSINILRYLSKIMYFGKQTKGEDSLIVARPNPQTEIYLSKGNLTFFDFQDKKQITIPFTKESLEKNEDKLKLFLSNKYHQVSNELLQEKKEGNTFQRIIDIKRDENNMPVAEVASYTSYKTYLLSDKEEGATRESSDIPLTTNVVNDEDMVMSTYLNYSLNPSDIKDKAVSEGKPTAIKTPAPAAVKSKEQVVLDSINKAIANKDFSEDSITAITDSYFGINSKYIEEYEKHIQDRPTVEDSISEGLEGDELDNYDTLVALKEVIEPKLTKTASAPTATISADEDNVGAEEVKSAEELANIFGKVDTQTSEDEDEETGTIEDYDEDEDEDGLARTQVTGSERIDIERAKDWLSKNLPQVSVEIKNKLINGIAQGKISPKGVIFLSELAEEGTEYHEALHGVMLGILSDDELKQVYTEAKVLYGEPTQSDLDALRKSYPKASEERLVQAFYDESLAEDFRTFALSNGKVFPSPKVKTIFQKIWDAVKTMLGLTQETSAVNSMFTKLYTGKYAEERFDADKARERAGGISVFRPLTFKIRRKDGSIGNLNKVESLNRTREILHAITNNLFKRIYSDNSSISDLNSITKSELAEYINQARDLTIRDLRNLPQTDATKNLITYLSDATNWSGKTGNGGVRSRILEYLQRDLGIDVGYREEEDIEENNKESKDNAWAKDSSTIHPREGMSSFVKLMIASLNAVERNADGKYAYKKGTIYGLPELVNPNTTYNHLLKLLHTAPTFDEMVKRLEANKTKVPYFQQLLDLLLDEPTAKKAPLNAFMMRVGFQQAMYKSAVNYRLWLVNEADVVSTDPNSERQELRIKGKWKGNMIDTIGKEGAIVYKNAKFKGVPTIRKEVVDKIVKESSKIHTPESFDYYVDVLNKLGLTITAPEEYSDKEKEALIDNAKYIVSEMRKTDVALDYLFESKVGGRIEKLAALEGIRDLEVTDLQHIGPDGKVRYGINQHNYISQISEYINSMPVGTSIDTLFMNFPQLNTAYSRKSYLLNNVLFRDTLGDGVKRRTSAPFKLSIIEGSRINKPGEEGDTNTKLDKADRTWISFNSILKGLTPILRTSDKSLEYGLQIGNDGIFSPEDASERRGEFHNIFLNYLEAELEMGKNTDVDDIQYFKKNVGDGLYFFEDILRGKVTNIRDNQEVREYINENKEAILDAIDKWIESESKEISKRLLANDIFEETKTISGKTVYKFNALDKGIIENLNSPSRISEANFDNIIKAFLFNSSIYNIEQTKLIFGYPGFYKDSVDFYKRTAGAVGTKTVSFVDDYINASLQSLGRDDGKIKVDGFVDTVVLADPITVSAYHSEIERSFVKEFGAEKGKKLAEEYLNMKESDGQGYITLPEYREFLLRNGAWSGTKESLYQAAMRGEDVNISKLKEVFNPLKAQYFALNKRGDTAVPVYLKFSLMPLIPSLYNGTNMQTIAESMLSNGIGIAAYPSGTKSGALMQDDEFLPMYDEDGNVVSFDEPNTLKLDYRHLGIQVETGYSVHNNVTAGSQQRKMLITNIFEDGIPSEMSIYEEGRLKKISSTEVKSLVNTYNSTVNQITEHFAKELLNELGAEHIGDGKYRISNFAKLASILRKQATNKNSPDNLIDSLKTEEKDGVVRMKYIFDSIPGRNKLENILFSLVNNNLIQQKYYGGSRIQGAATGFEKSGPRQVFDREKGTLKSNSELRFYTKGLHGETLPAQVKMTVPSTLKLIVEKLGGINVVNQMLKELWALDMQDGVVKGGARYDEAKLKEFRDKGLDPDMFQFIAYRIPTQGVNTLEHLEIAEFLPDSSGELILCPSELVAKSGGDYDIDKLNIYYKQADKKGRVITGTSIEGLQNKLIYINQLILGSPEMYNELLIPNSAITLKPLAVSIRDIVQGKEVTSKTKSLSWGFNLDVAEYYLVGKAAVGIVARHNTHHILSQQSGLSVNKQYNTGNNEVESSQMKFEGMEDEYSLAKKSDIKGVNKISHIISEFLTSFVDIARDPFIFGMNGSTKTADLFMYMVRRGVPINSVAYFMNQPIIREYYNKLAGGSAQFKKGKLNVEGEELAQYNSDIKKQLVAMLNQEAAKLGFKGELKYSGVSFSESRLKGNLGKSIENQSLTFIRDQFDVLNDFMRYAEQANALRELMDYTSDDTRRPKNFNSYDNNLGIETSIRNTDLFSEEAVKSLYDNTILSTFAKAQKVNEVFRDLFMSEDETPRAYIAGLRNLLNNKDKEAVDKVTDKFKNDLIVYAYSVFQKNGIRLGSLQKDLFTGNNSLVDQINKTLKSPNPIVKNNPFYKAIIADLANQKSIVKTLKQFNVKLTTFDVNQIVNGFDSLPEDRKIVLAAFILFQSGLDNSPITWYDKVSVNTMNSILATPIENLRNSMDAITMQNFSSAFIRNNFMNKVIAPSVGTFKTDGSGSIKINEKGEVKIEKRSIRGKNFVKVFAQYPEYNNDKEALERDSKNGIKTGEWLLLFRKEDNVFKLANKFGDGMYMKEYHNNSESILPENNIDQGRFAGNFSKWKNEPFVTNVVPDSKNYEKVKGEIIEKAC